MTAWVPITTSAIPPAIASWISRLRAADSDPDNSGVFDLSFDWTHGSWQLVGCLD